MSELATVGSDSVPTGHKRPALALTLLLAVLTSSIPRIPRRLLLRQKLHQLFGFFALPGLGRGLGLFRFPPNAVFLVPAGALNGFRGLALFLGALVLAVIAR